MEVCRYCGRTRGVVCKNTRDMKEVGDGECYTELIRCGGGEYTDDQMAGERLDSQLCSILR